MQLKLYAINFEILPKITMEYNSKATADSAKTIVDWNNRNREVDHFLLSYPITLWSISLVLSILIITSFLFAKPHDYMRRVKELIRYQTTRGRATRTHLFMVVALSMAFSTYVFCMDIAAFHVRDEIHKEFYDWYKYKVNRSVSCFITLDGLTLLFLFTALALKSAMNIRYFFIRRNYKKKIVKFPGYHFFNVALPYYFVLGPILNMAAHINLIVIRFIQNPYHATAITVTYGILIFSCIAVLEILLHLFHYCCTDYSKGNLVPREPGYEAISKNSKGNLVPGKPGNEVIIKRCSYCFDRYGSVKFTCGVCLFFLAVLLMFLVSVYLNIFYFFLPINIAFDVAPNHIISVVVLLAGFISYWSLPRLYKSPLDVLIQAKDSIMAKEESDEGKEWKEKSDAAKEQLVAIDIVKIMTGLQNHKQHGQDGTEAPEPIRPTHQPLKLEWCEVFGCMKGNNRNGNIEQSHSLVNES